MKIGVAFAGGGARGGAHVGVLKVLEEMRIPVDYIAGTSIGSIVGALYATGMSPEEMDQVLSTTDWDDALQDKEARPDIPYRLKQDDGLYLIRAELGFYKGKLVLPAGIVAGEKLGYLLRRLTLPVSSVRDFDSFPIPYRAVASDIVTGDKVVLGKGDIARALRASMAIPGFFTPVELEGRLLTDGGTADNLPIDVVRAMGADIVIAIDISTPLATREQLKNFLAITNQTSGFLTRLNVLEQIETLTPRDILITPDLEGVGTLNFAQFPEAVKRGTASAERAREALSRLSVSEEEYAAFLKKQRVARRDPKIDAVRVEPPAGVDPRIYRDRVRSKPGVLDWKVLEKDLGRLYELGDFETVDFFIEEEGGISTLVFRGRPKPPAPVRARFGLKLDTDFEANSSFGLRLGIYATRLNALRGEVRTRMEVGRRNGINFELYQPIEYSGRFFVAPTVGFLRSPVDAFIDDQIVASLLVDHFFGQLDVGYSLGSLGEIRAGVRRDWGFVDTVVFTGAPRSDEIDVSAATVSLALDQLDSVTFPRRGWFVRSEIFEAGTVAGGTDSYGRMTAGGGFAKSFGESTLVGAVSVDTRLGGNERPFYDQAALGGFFNLSGLKPGQILGQYGGIARLIAYHRLARMNSMLGTGVYLGGSLETGNVWDDSGDIRFSNLRAAGSVFVAADTLIGPLYLGYGLADRGNASFYLALGLPLN